MKNRRRNCLLFFYIRYKGDLGGTSFAQRLRSICQLADGHKNRFYCPKLDHLCYNSDTPNPLEEGKWQIIKKN